MQSQPGQLKTTSDDEPDPIMLARAKRHSLILGLIFALILIALPSKSKTPTTTTHPPAIETSNSETQIADPHQPQPPVGSSLTHRPDGVHLSSTAYRK